MFVRMDTCGEIQILPPSFSGPHTIKGAEKQDSVNKAIQEKCHNPRQQTTYL